MNLLANVNWGRVGIILLIGVAAWIGFRAVLAAIRRLLHGRIQDIEDRKRIDTLDRSLRYLFNTMLVVVFAVLMMTEFGLSVAPLLGAAGIVGVALGFAAQSLVKDFFRGVFLLLENQIRVGDVVEIAGKTGSVEEVTLRYVRLRNLAGHVHFVSNGEITTVTNLSLGFAFAVVDVPVAQAADLDAVIASMKEEALALQADPAFKDLITAPLEMLGVDSWQEFSLIVRARFRTMPMHHWPVRREFLRRIKTRLTADGVPLVEPVFRVSQPGQA